MQQRLFNNRLNVIAAQGKSYTDMISTLNRIKSELKNKRKHPFIKDKTFQKFDLILKTVSSELEDAEKMHFNRLFNDPIKIKLGELLNDKIGPEYSQEQIDQFSKTAHLRFQDKIPPGYKDQSKSDGKDQKLK